MRRPARLEEPRVEPLTPAEFEAYTTGIGATTHRPSHWRVDHEGWTLVLVPREERTDGRP